MNPILISVIVLAVLVVLSNVFSRKQTPSGGSCQKCPEYRYCGGGKPRCPRRGERKN